MTEARKPLTVPELSAMKARGEKIATLTAYDATFAAAMDEAGVDLVLVGDSLGMVVQGHPTTLPVTLDQMVYHATSVGRGLQRAILAVDLPFLTYTTPGQALASAARLVREGGAQVVKLEGGRQRVEVIRALAGEAIPVCAHLGLLPQSVHRIGGYRVQGRDEQDARTLLEDALLLQEAGASLLVLECVPAALAADITAALSIPTIGIGAGPACDGQVLVAYDLLGLTPHCPRVCRNFLAGADSICDAFSGYVNAVRERTFPGPEHSY
jgi:3-methyl-2-oxobutanoate hydroxymethyltransferase